MSNLVQGKGRQATKSVVSFPTLPSLSLQPMKSQLFQEEYQHDVLVLEFNVTYENWFSLLKTGVPVQFTWTQESFSNTWIGYVSSISKQVSAELQQIMEVTCIGATFPLKERTTRTFTNSSIPQAVETIVSEFGFNYIGEQHPLVFDQLTIAGHSYWEWIQEQAKRIGYGVFVQGMNFMFKPLDKIIDFGITSVPVFAMTGKGIAMNQMTKDRTLDYFKVFNTEHYENPSALRAVKSVSGVNPLTNEVFSSTSSPKNVGVNLRSDVSDVLFSEVRTEQVAHNMAAAASLSSGAAHNARMSLPAKVSGQGDPRIKVFNPILVQGTGTLTDGYWVVKKVKHVFSRNGNYQVEMMTATDGTGISARTSTRQGTNTVVGMVNLTDALNNGGVNNNTADVNAFKLITPLGVPMEANQGFVRTPNRWVYSATTTKGAA